MFVKTLKIYLQIGTKVKKQPGHVEIALNPGEEQAFEV